MCKQIRPPCDMASYAIEVFSNVQLPEAAHTIQYGILSYVSNVTFCGGAVGLIITVIESNRR